MAKRYQPSELIGEQGGVQTFAGRDVVNGLPVRVYSFVGEPTLKEGELRSDFAPPVLSSSFTGLAGEVVSAFSDEFRGLKGAVAPGQVEALLRETAAALDDAAKVGVVHGDLSPERLFFDREGGAGGRFILEGYGVPWPVRPSEFSAPERIGGASFAGDIFSWARTVKHLSGPLPGELHDLLDRCLNADPKERPQAREVRAALERYPFSSGNSRTNPQAHRDTSAFERYAEDDAEDYQDYGDYPEEADTERDSLRGSGLTTPPKTFKLKEYRRQTATHKPAQPTEQAGQPKQARQTEQPAPKQSLPGSNSADTIVNDPGSGTVKDSGPVPSTRALSPRPPPKVQAVSSPPKPPRSKDALSQTDAVAAYRVRLAAYQAKHGLQDTPQPDTYQADIPHRDVPDEPATTPTFKTASETAPVTAPTPAPSETSADPSSRPAAAPPPRVHVQRLPDTAETISDAGWGDSSSGPNELDFGDAFEVDDDINDRAPDPTLYRGGRRVFLLTLLGVAVLVLLALQLINA